VGDYVIGGRREGRGYFVGKTSATTKVISFMNPFVIQCNDETAVKTEFALTDILPTHGKLMVLFKTKKRTPLHLNSMQKRSILLNVSQKVPNKDILNPSSEPFTK
jgi:hypothetical protein